MSHLLEGLTREFDRLRDQVIMPAKGLIKYDYLTPGGFYKQMWDWDGFFIGMHLATRSEENAKYLKWWALNFLHKGVTSIVREILHEAISGTGMLLRFSIFR